MNATLPSFYVTGGTLRYDAPSYVEREADRELLDGLQQGEFCYVLTSRQMGKSSLMVRTAGKLRAQGLHVVVLDLTAIGQNLTPEQWYDGMATQMARQLQLEEEVERYWTAHVHLGPCQRFFAAIGDTILPDLQRRARVPPALPPAEPTPAPNRSPTAPSASNSLVIFVDEIDVVRNLPFSTDEFFAATRECYNRRTQDPELNRVTFCLLGVATPSDLIRDTRLTPFNIGQRIELNDFTTEEAAPLAEGLENPNFKIENRKVLLERILHWTGGHPYLTQRLCRAVAEADEHGHSHSASLTAGRLIDRLCEGLFFSSQARERDDNLIFVRERLLRAETDVVSLLEEYLKVRSGRKVIDDDTSALVNVLKLSGIVKSEEGGLRERNRIYSSVFDREWIRTHMPDADLRRQRTAFRRGVVRTTGIAAVVVAALTIVVLIAVNQTKIARRALAQNYFSQAQARRVSGLTGQRYESLGALDKARRDYTDAAALRDEAIACLALVDLKLDLVRTNFPPGATAVALSPTLDQYAIGEDSGGIVVRRTVDDRVTTRLPPIGLPVGWVALSPDGQALAAQYTGDRGDRFVLWKLDSVDTVVESTNRVHPGAIDFSADGTQLAVVFAPEVLDVISLPAGQRVARLPLRQVTNTPRVPGCVRFDPLGRRVAEAGAGSQRACIWDLANQTVTNRHFASEITALAWSPDAHHLAAAGVAGLTLWDLQYGRSRPLKEPQAEVELELAFNPDGTLLAATDGNRTLRLWCPSTARHVTESLPAGATGRIFFSRDGRRLGLAGLRTGVRLWRVEGGDEYRVFRAGTEIYAPFNSLDFDPEGRILVGASDMGAFFWDTATGRTLPTLAMHSIRCVRLHPVTGDLYASGPHGLFRQQRRVVQGSFGFEYIFGNPHSLALPGGLERFSLGREGKEAVVVHSRHVHWFRTDDLTATAVLPFQGNWKALALSPDGKWLATWSETERQIHVRRMTNAGTADRPVKVIPAGRYFSFTPDSRFLLTGLGQSNQLWSTETWTATSDLKGLTLSQEADAPVAFGRLADSGRTLFAIPDETGIIRLHELTGGAASNAAPAFRLLARLEDPDRKRVTALTFNPQGSRLAAATHAQTIQVWDLARVRRGLAALTLAEALPEFSPGAKAPLTLTFNPTPPGPSHAKHWLSVEELTFALAEATNTNPSIRANQLLDRGRIYLQQLDRAALAKADFEEALRLKPDDVSIRALRDQARQKLRPRLPKTL